MYALLLETSVWHIAKNNRTNREFKFMAKIGNIEMDNAILDLGYDVKIIPMETQEQMGKPKLV